MSFKNYLGYSDKLTGDKPKKRVAKKMKVKGFSSMSKFEKWAKESGYDPKHKRDSNSPAGIHQAKGSYYSKAGKSEEVKKGKWWKN